MVTIIKFRRKYLTLAAFLVLVTMVGLFFFMSMKPDNSPYNLTDNNWDAGVSRNEVSFFVENNRANSKAFKIGVPIEFKSGERQIVKILPSELYLNVFLAGNKLDPSRDGFPNKFKIGKVKVNFSNTPFDLTDDNWQSGVSRNFAGFFVENNSLNQKQFKIGALLRLASGEREIIDVIASESYLNVYLSGEVLNPITDGHPNKFEFDKIK